MSNILSRLGRGLSRPFLPPRLNPRAYMSDANGLTGQGPLMDPALADQSGLEEPDPYSEDRVDNLIQAQGSGGNDATEYLANLQNPDNNRLTLPPPPQDSLPPRVREIPQSAFPQNGSTWNTRRLPPSAFQATGNEPPPQSGSQLPPTDPALLALRDKAAEGPPVDHPKVWRQILAGVAGMTAAAPFAPMIEHGPGFLRQQSEWARGQQQLPARLKVEEAISKNQDQQADNARLDLARKDLEYRQQQAIQGQQQGETEKFLQRGEFRTPESMNLDLPPMQAPPPDDTAMGPPLPPSVRDLPPQQSAMSQLPKRIQVPVSAQLGTGERIEPGMPYDPKGSTRVGVTAAELARRKAETLRSETEKDWLTVPDTTIKLPPAQWTQYMDAHKPKGPTNEYEGILSEFTGPDGTVDYHKANAEYNKRLIARRPPGSGTAAQGLLDREVKQFGAPHAKALADAQGQLEKISDARVMLKSGAEGQALGLPKVLSSLVGGPNSGLRMTEPELNRIATARGIAGSIEGFFNSIQGQGKLAKGQIDQLNGILDDIQARVEQKRVIASDAADRMESAGTREEIIQISKEARQKIADMEKASSAASSPGAPPVGTVVNGFKFKGGNHRDKANWEKVGP